MAMLNNLNQFTNVNRGERVDRVAEEYSTGVAGALATPLFTIAGGRVAIREVVGEITVGASGTMEVLLQSNPTTGTTASMCAALDLLGLEVGTILGITGTVANAMYGVSAGVTQCQLRDQILPIGAIELLCTAPAPTTTTTSAPTIAETVTIKWSVFYVPIDDGAYIEAT